MAKKDNPRRRARARTNTAAEEKAGRSSITSASADTGAGGEKELPMAGQTLDEQLRAADQGISSAAPIAAPAGADDPGALGVPAVVDVTQEWIDAVMLWGPVLRETVPADVQPHWTDERLYNVGVRLGAVGKHYKWTVGDAIGHPVPALIAACFPLLWPMVEPMVKPHLNKLFGKKEKEVSPNKANAIDPPPPAPVSKKPNTIDPID